MRENTTKTMDALIQQTSREIHEEYLKYKDKLPPGFEEQENRKLAQMLREMPLDEMLEAIVPVYQKHLTKADVDALIAFYSSPTGQKLATEEPAIMAEYMQAVQPIMQKNLGEMLEHMHKDVAQLTKDSKPSTSRD